jgi:hypothetical protein
MGIIGRPGTPELSRDQRTTSTARSLTRAGADYFQLTETRSHGHWLVPTQIARTCTTPSSRAAWTAWRMMPSARLLRLQRQRDYEAHARPSVYFPGNETATQLFNVLSLTRMQYAGGDECAQAAELMVRSCDQKRARVVAPPRHLAADGGPPRDMVSRQRGAGRRRAARAVRLRPAGCSGSHSTARRGQQTTGVVSRLRAAIRTSPLQHGQMPTLCCTCARVRIPRAAICPRPLQQGQMAALSRVRARIPPPVPSLEGLPR